jgi:peptidoglycan/xylan/chitin deacetylase (PgdA/CDA1 family)
VSASALAASHRSAFLKASAGIHAAAGLGLAAAPGAWPYALLAVAANHAAIGLAGLFPRSRFLGPNVTRLPDRPGAKVVALTFDDGPDPEITPRVLDILDAHGARATFFCIGREVDRYPRLARSIVDRGHQVENHSYRHSHRFGFLGPTHLRREIDRAQQAIESATGRRPGLFRAPAGVRNPFVQPALDRLGLRLVSWTRRGFDTVSRRTDRVLSRLVTGLGPGDILLLHDGAPVGGRRDGAVALEALPMLLEALAAHGLSSLPVAEALAGAEP